MSDAFLDRAVIEGIARGLGGIATSLVSTCRGPVVTGRGRGALTTVGNARVAGRAVVSERLVVASDPVVGPDVVVAVDVVTAVTVTVVGGRGRGAGACSGDSGARCSGSGSGSGVVTVLTGSVGDVLTGCAVVSDRAAVSDRSAFASGAVIGEGSVVPDVPLVSHRATCLVVPDRAASVVVPDTVTLVTIPISVTEFAVAVTVVGGRGRGAGACSGDSGARCCGSGPGVVTVLAGSVGDTLVCGAVVGEGSAVPGVPLLSHFPLVSNRTACLVVLDPTVCAVAVDGSALASGPIVGGGAVVACAVTAIVARAVTIAVTVVGSRSCCACTCSGGSGARCCGSGPGVVTVLAGSVSRLGTGVLLAMGLVGAIRRRIGIEAIGLGATLLDDAAVLIHCGTLLLGLGATTLRGDLLLLRVLRLLLGVEVGAVGLELGLLRGELTLLDLLLVPGRLLSQLGGVATVLLLLSGPASLGHHRAHDDQDDEDDKYQNDDSDEYWQ